MPNLPMPGGSFGYYSGDVGVRNWLWDWRDSWHNLYLRLSEIADDMDRRITFAMRLEEL